MIRTFRCKETQPLFEGGHPKRFRAIETVATRKVAMLDAAKTLDFFGRRRAIGSKRSRVTGLGGGGAHQRSVAGVLRVDRGRSG